MYPRNCNYIPSSGRDLCLLEDVHTCTGTHQAPFAGSLSGECNWSQVHPITGYEGPERMYRCSSNLSLNSTLDGDGSSKPSSDRFTPEERPRRAGGWVNTSTDLNEYGKSHPLPSIPQQFLYRRRSLGPPSSTAELKDAWSYVRTPSMS
jgi:hypothetical protein